MTEAAEPESTVQDCSGMTPGALVIWLSLAITMVAFGIFCQPFAYSKLHGADEVSYRPYVVGISLAILAAVCIATSRWQSFALVVRLPIWSQALLATSVSLTLTYAFKHSDNYSSGQMALIPVLFWAALNSDSRNPQSGDTAPQLTFSILSMWAMSFSQVSLEGTFFGLTFLALTAKQSSLRSVITHTIGLTCCSLIVYIGTSPYSQDRLVRYLGFEDPVIWWPLGEMISDSLHNDMLGVPVILPGATNELLLTSFIEMAGWLPGLLIGITSLVLLCWSTISLARNKQTWASSFGLAVSFYLIPISLISVATNLSVTLFRPGMSLPFFGPEIANFAYVGCLLGTLIATNSVRQ